MKKVVKLLAITSTYQIQRFYAARDTAACVGCHGQNFEKAALGKSKIVKDMTKDEIVKALKGYKDGSYGVSYERCNERSSCKTYR